MVKLKSHDDYFNAEDLRGIGEAPTELQRRLLQVVGTKATDAKLLNNRMYKAWKSQILTPTQFRVFMFNYHSRVTATANRVTHALTMFNDPLDMIELWHNIGDELGHGNINCSHPVILRRWIDSLYSRLRSHGDAENAFVDLKPATVTINFINETIKLCKISKKSAAGALLAQEWHGYDQIGILLDGYQNYRNLFERNEFHDNGEYFYVHLGLAEKMHRDQAVRIVLRNCSSQVDYDEILGAFSKYIDLLIGFWEGVFEISIGSARKDGFSNNLKELIQ